MITSQPIFLSYKPLSVSGASYIGFRVGVSVASSIVVDWGDGSKTSYSGSLMAVSHTYTSTYTGVIKIACQAGIGKINRIDTFDINTTANAVRFTLSEVQAFTGLVTFSCDITNIITGNLSNILPSVTRFIVEGSNTITGDISSLPSNIVTFVLRGSNTTFGNIQDAPATLTTYTNEGSNIVTGNIANVPPNLVTFTSGGNSTITGDIGDIPISLTTLNLGGMNNVSGDIGNLHEGLLSFMVLGLNTVTGDLAGLPSTLVVINVSGFNTISGDISNLPPSLVTYNVSGANTTTGDMGDLPLTTTYYSNTGLNTVVDYTAGRAWANNMRLIINKPYLAGLSSTEVDNLLIDLASVLTWATVSGLPPSIDLSGYNSAPTGAASSAIATIQSKGVTVTTN